jgi:hypothetical protein
MFRQIRSFSLVVLAAGLSTGCGSHGDKGALPRPAGEVRIPTLEAGKHRFHVASDSSTHEITIPPLSPNGIERTTVEVRLAKPKASQ